MEELFDLIKFNEYKEDNRREVKSAKGGLPKSLWSTYSAMCNTYGGVIILGVEERDDGSWQTTGLRDVASLKKAFWDTINNRAKVSINLLKESDLKEYKVGDDAVLVIKVPAADREFKPVYLNNDLFGSSFKRNHEGDYHCTRAEVQAMFRDQARKTVDGNVMSKMDISALVDDSIKSYRLVMESKRPGHPFLNLAKDEFLVKIGAASKTEEGVYRPTRAGLLMFGEEYQILYEYPLYFLDYREHLLPNIRWTDRIQSQSGDWSGNVYDFFTRVSAKLVLDLKRPFKLVDMVRVDETPLHDAVREALVNCLVNADYYEPRGVVVEKYPDKITLRNPGTAIVGKTQMLRGGESEPRNGNVMKMFNLIGFGERAGSGVPDIYTTWEQEGYANPQVEEIFGGGQPNRTIVTLPLVGKEEIVSGGQFQKQPEKHPEKQPEKHPGKQKEIEARIQAVLLLIREDPSVTRPKIMEKLNITEAQARTVIETLKNRGVIHYEGSSKNGRWIID
ncbi:MAG: putative DNA binding domain-containing protein [Acidaminococcaceae bacterium]|nr:putative DNA binding domain-containing protein [Acidaminococcaceae bacterium]